MLNILINAYACSPSWGSEPGMAWNWVINLARHCNLFVITEGEWRAEIEEAVAKLPQRDHLHFHFNPVSEKVRRMCWNQGDWRFYWHYRKWQRRTLRIAEQICSEQRIDVIHQLNMIGFREPGYLWKLPDIPFIWGPIGGMDLLPVAFLQGVGWKITLINRLKNMINAWQMHQQPRVLKAIERSDWLVAATKGSYDILHGYYHKNNVSLINETGCYEKLQPECKQGKKETLDLLWVGKFDFRKRLDLAIQSIAAMRDNERVRLHVVGEDRESIVAPFKRLAEREGIADKVVWHGKVPHEEINELMLKADLFFFTSIMDATSTVIVEALQNGLPIVCFDTCGFGPLVDGTIGAKVPVTTPEAGVKAFAEILTDINAHRERLAVWSRNCAARAAELSWEKKAERMAGIYERVVRTHGEQGSDAPVR